ncbi:MAG: hypothetical protein A2X13_14690 [Bacteroidetes bacterium GWC2_33_15]|nr:MAG: hypothetical protein A2X10_06755 [Bacteroidetes bacterium GWA2_33_15]OFX50120.1 MAG: hypothetical protein A2X13_14690 [Bacteroidetes bacterium GWC2_33_15]OFX65273.1 MAG: hypothetical protein A2X15_04265 [Bacteroidetes bacterium GWB2_32_14]OFX70499.1 MAG: hypothetical protein A2X14_04320 [Bacteroidetes bacterium GWD2_33_33]HAN19628.1 UDP-glycosyltransferase [Bacteroidales bacterium]
MKILLTNHWLKKLGGSETFTYTLAGELTRLEHEVHLFTNIPGAISQRICSDFSIPLITDPRTRKYDMVLANHNSCVSKIYPTNNKVVQTCHGIVPQLEQPSSLADLFVSVSEEVRDHLLSLGFESTIIRNGIDCERFKPTTKLNGEIKTVLSLSHSEELNEMLHNAFAGHKIRFISLNKFKNPVWDVEKYINQADMVVSLGRGVFEAMACGRPVLVLDHRPYQDAMGDGLLTFGNIDKSIYNNCSGRAFKNKNIKPMIDFAIGYYRSSIGEWCRNYALKELNIINQTQKYLQLYESI